MNSPNAPDQVQ